MVVLVVFRGQFTMQSISKIDPANCLALGIVGDPIITMLPNKIARFNQYLCI